ncbi:hypothetical protein CALVIDRAFT_560806 [Calocera viscosa TUFC12733]|uniref:Replication protein A subunit n=1 Tax=Calocera viscosa (strain TUFC12733) TaxID=1330018 RepID=A0A167QT93_CALVF|nr:hypothetical protein CALVIDRAFT_560806 [Calocera viscosa TUFC12733]
MAHIGVQMPLTVGACRHLMFGNEENYSCVLQILKIIQLNGEDGRPLQPFAYHDGDKYIHAGMGADLVDLVEQGFLRQGRIIRVTKYTKSNLEGDNYCVVTIQRCELGAEKGGRIGSPSLLKKTEEPPVGHFDAQAIQAAVQQGYPNQVVPPPPPVVAGVAGFQHRIVASSAVAAGPVVMSPRVNVDNITPDAIGSHIVVRVTVIGEKKDFFDHRKQMTKYRRTMEMHDGTGEIGAVCWEEAVDATEQIELNAVYLIQQWGVGRAHSVYSRVRHPRQLIFNSNTVFTKVPNNPAIPDCLFSFIKLNEVDFMSRLKRVDVLAVVDDAGSRMASATRSESEGEGAGSKGKGKDTRPKTTLRSDSWLVDPSRVKCRVVLFDHFVDALSGLEGKVVAIKGLVTDSVNGRCLKSKRDTTVIVVDDNNVAHAAVQDWYNNNLQDRAIWRAIAGGYSADGRPDHTSTLPIEAMDIGTVKKNKLDAKEKRFTFIIYANIRIDNRDPVTYNGCPVEECNRKLHNMGGGMWFCKTHDEVVQGRRQKLKLNFRAYDGTGSEYVTVFNTVSSWVLQKKADAMHQLEERGDFEGVNVYQHILTEFQKKKWKITVQAHTDKEGEHKGKATWIGIDMEEIPR